jgi:hypothetical protein
MMKKIACAAALACGIALPASTAHANSFHFGIEIPGGYFSFGTGPEPYPQPQPQSLSCWQAKNYLETQFAQVWTVECNGQVYTFDVKHFSQIKTVKINRNSWNYWFA